MVPAQNWLDRVISKQTEIAADQEGSVSREKRSVEPGLLTPPGQGQMPLRLCRSHLIMVVVVVEAAAGLLCFR